MVHLASVPNDSAREKPLVEGMQKIDINQDEDEQTVSVYGSRFASQELPAHEMPEQEMPKEVAYRMIRDDLSLDGNPMLNLASFVTTYMASTLGRARYTNVMKKLTIIRRKRSRS
jgi:glutamate decarboxylase